MSPLEIIVIICAAAIVIGVISAQIYKNYKNKKEGKTGCSGCCDCCLGSCCSSAKTDDGKAKN